MVKALRLPLVYHNSVLANSVFLLFGLLLLLGCFPILNNGDGRGHWIAWLWVVGVGGQMVPVAKRLFDRTPQLTITSTSVTKHSRQDSEIFWVDIKAASLWSDRTGTFICLELVNAEKYLSQLSPLQRRRGMASVGTRLDLLGFLPVKRHLKKCSKVFALDLTGLKANTDELLATVQSLIMQTRGDT